MKFVSRYVSHKPNPQGIVQYAEEEQTVWQMLYERQIKIILNRACKEFIQGIDYLKLSGKTIPQLPEISRLLYDITGWQVVPVEALISAREFFQLLANRQFPAATFIRSLEEINYVKEPDIFHELFGHCPMLTNADYAEFIYQYACQVLSFPEEDWPLLQRLFWFTVEFGLIKTHEGLRAYGGGILSSITETPYSIESDLPMRVVFHPLAAFRTPYRIDQLQSVYFVIDSYQMLHHLINSNLANLICRAKELGEYPPFFPVENGNQNIHINAC